MQRSTLARRYAPLAAVVAVQLLIIALAPSTALKGRVTTGRSGVAGQVAAGGGGAGDNGAGGTVGTDAGGNVAASGGGGGGTTGVNGVPGSVGAANGGGGGGAQGGGVLPPGVSPKGDTTHCKAGRQYDPAVDSYAPPCVPKFSGDNGGATAMGVTKDQIEIVDYYDKGSDAVNAILKAEGAYVSIDQLRAFDKAAETFINAHYELYGRKVHIDVVQGISNSIPPDVPNLRKEFDDIIAQYKPFGLKWDTSLCSACYDEISQKGVVNVGGYNFTDDFNRAHAPYHYDTFESGTRIAQALANYYCTNLKGKAAQWAGTQNPADQLNGKPRVIGVISTNDPENKREEAEFDQFLSQGCGIHVAHTYFYAQDITTAEQQRAAGVSAMRQSPESTTVVCLCDPVAPAFLFEEEQQENYYPENVIGGTQGIDTDPIGQSFGPGAGGQPSLACPTPARGCEFDGVVGIATQPVPAEPKFADRGSRVWKAGGGAGQPPFEAVSRTWDYLNLLATLIQQAGPQLTPESANAGMLATAATGGNAPNVAKRAIGANGNFGWTQDSVAVFWDKNRTSPYNGKPGSFIAVGGRVDPTGYHGGFSAPAPEARN